MEREWEFDPVFWIGMPFYTIIGVLFFITTHWEMERTGRPVKSSHIFIGAIGWPLIILAFIAAAAYCKMAGWHHSVR